MKVGKTLQAKGKNNKKAPKGSDFERQKSESEAETAESAEGKALT